MEMPSREEGGDLADLSSGGAGGAPEVSCSWEEESAQHLNCVALLMREEAEGVLATATRVSDGKEMARAADMVAMGGGQW